MKKETIAFRCSAELKGVLQSFVKLHSLDISTIMENSLVNFLKNFDTIKKDADFISYKTNRIMQNQKEKLKRRQEQRYFFRNFYRGLFMLCASHKMHNGCINTESTSSYIEDVLELFKTFDDDIKEELKNDVDMIRELLKPEKLKQKYDNFAFFMLNNKQTVIGDSKK